MNILGIGLGVFGIGIALACGVVFVFNVALKEYEKKRDKGNL